MRDIKPLGSRVFTLKDQEKFALFSGDFNPIHVSPLLARRLIAGECIVHGIHSFLWGLEELAKRGVLNFRSFDIIFRNYIPLDKKVYCIFKPEENRYQIEYEGVICVDVLFEKNNSIYKPEKNIGLNLKKIISKPQFIKQESLRINENIEPYFSGDKSYCHKIFPLLSKTLGEGILCQIASLSEIIGMQVPGMNSLFSKAHISFKKSTSPPTIEIIESDLRFKKVRIRCQFKNILSNLEAFCIQTPLKLKSLNQLYKEFNNLNFEKANALIIGGSRGLGACVAQLIIIGGGKVTITYNTGEDEARILKQDILSWGGQCNILKLNVLSDKISLNKELKFNQLYYFASPKIKENKSLAFDRDLYKKYFEHFVSGLDKLYKNFSYSTTLKIFYPSTIFIEDQNKFFKEYIKAKFEGEYLCKKISMNNNLKIIKPRLPRLMTDQNYSLIPGKYCDNYSTLLPHVIQMQ